MKLTITKISSPSLAKFYATLMASIALLVFLPLAIFTSIQFNNPYLLLITVIVPILYSVLGLIFGYFGATIFNIISSVTGGITLETSTTAPQTKKKRPISHEV